MQVQVGNCSFGAKVTMVVEIAQLKDIMVEYQIKNHCQSYSGGEYLF